MFCIFSNFIICSDNDQAGNLKTVKDLMAGSELSSPILVYSDDDDDNDDDDDEHFFSLRIRFYEVLYM